ncbi:hypothetical protein ACOMHN_038771 [Nucella lapillus]
MAESLLNDEKLSMTSDLGSSCCDNDTDMSCDVKDISDDVISVAESTTMTIDSLEEEDSKEQQRFEISTATMEQLNSSCSPHTEQSAVDCCKDRSHVSKVVHAERSGRDDVDSSEPPCSEKEIKEGDLHYGADKLENKPGNKADVQQTTARCKQTETKLQSSEALKDTQRDSAKVPQKTNGSSSTSNAKSEKSHHLSEYREEKLVIRKSQSLTDESSTDPSPKLPRRSGIPRRKSSTQSMITVMSSGSGTPQNSPGRVRRSMTLDSSGDCHQPAGSRWVFNSSAGASPRSFPSSPVRVPSQLRRSASQCECCSVSGVSCPPLSVSRDNVTSRLRFEKSHRQHDQAELPYLTPTQRKDVALKELRLQVRELSSQLTAKGQELDHLSHLVEQEKLQIRRELGEGVEEARAAAEAARREASSLQESHTQSVKTVATLRQQLDDVKKDMRNKLAESEQIFLEMYNKGRQSAIFEHQEEVELKRKGGRSQEATEKELYTKLVRTQAELAKWQTIQRHESYTTMPVPGTEAETTLRFLKDSVFHFLTSDKTSSDEHLRAIVRILHFSEVQRDKIAHTIIMKRNKTGW